MSALLLKLAPYKTAALLLVFLALAGAVGIQSVRLDRAELKLQVCEESKKGLNVLIEAQNAGIAAVKAEAEASKAAALAANEAASQALSKAQSRVVVINKAPTPKTCEDAIKFLVQDAGEKQ